MGALSLNGDAIFREGFGPLLADCRARPLERSAGAGGGAGRRRRGRVHRRADPGQGREPAGARLSARGGPPLSPARHAVRRRRGADGARAHRHVPGHRARGASIPIWCSWPRRSRAATCRWARSPARSGSSTRRSTGWTAPSCTARRSARTTWPWPPGWPRWQVLDDEKLIENAARRGESLMRRLKALCGRLRAAGRRARARHDDRPRAGPAEVARAAGRLGAGRQGHQGALLPDGGAPASTADTGS